jgi:hypothetical protein
MSKGAPRITTTSLMLGCRASRLPASTRRRWGLEARLQDVTALTSITYFHRPVAAVSELAAIGSDTRERLTVVASRLAAAVTSRADLTWTYCHGDCHGFNARIPSEGPRAGQAVFFDLTMEVSVTSPTISPFICGHRRLSGAGHMLCGTRSLPGTGQCVRSSRPTSMPCIYSYQSGISG